MSTGWTWEPAELAGVLESLGYDVTRRDARLDQGGGSLIARRDRGGRAHLVAVDAGGRFRAQISVSLDETGGEVVVAEVAVRIVTRTERVTTITGTLSERRQLAKMVGELDRLERSPPKGDQPAVADGAAEW